MELCLARTTEQGARQLVWAAIGGTGNEDELRGAFISSTEVTESSDYVISEEGEKAQNKIWVCLSKSFLYISFSISSYL